MQIVYPESVPTLYYRPTCPYSKKVIAVAMELGLGLDLRDIANEENRRALIAKGGRQQVPYLVDEARSAEMYESEDIVAYLKQHHVPQGVGDAGC